MLLSFLFGWLGCAHAGCTAIASFVSRDLYIDISDGGCAGGVAISFSRKIRKDLVPAKSSIEKYLFDEECVAKLGKNFEISEFSCHPNGRTPIAGATFKLKHAGYVIRNCGLGDYREERFQYVCVDGCKRGIPKALEKEDPCD